MIIKYFGLVINNIFLQAKQVNKVLERCNFWYFALIGGGISGATRRFGNFMVTLTLYENLLEQLLPPRSEHRRKVVLLRNRSHSSTLGCQPPPWWSSKELMALKRLLLPSLLESETGSAFEIT